MRVRATVAVALAAVVGAVSNQQFAEITQSVRESDVQVIGINDRAQMAPLLAIFDRGTAIGCETRRTLEETRVWFRFNEREHAEKRDAMSLPQTGIVGPTVRVRECYLKHVDPRRWFSKVNINGYLKAFRAGLAGAGAAIAEDGDQHTGRLDHSGTGLRRSKLGRRKARAADASL